MNQSSNRFNNNQSQRVPTFVRGPVFGQIWNRQKNSRSAKNRAKSTFGIKNVDNENGILNSLSKQTGNLEDRPSSIYRFNDREFLLSLRNHHHHAHNGIVQTSLARYWRMSREIVDDFVRMKSDQYENAGDIGGDTAGADDAEQISPLTNNRAFRKNTVAGGKKRIVRPKSATTARRKAPSMTNGMGGSKSTSKLNKTGADSDDDQEDPANDIYDEELKPLFHRSMDKISSIANWERQIRYELEIEKELQKRELERQREKLQNDQRKLEDWDKQLRIELDARERKLRLGEEELKSRLEEYGQKSNDLMRREQMINEIVTERIKAEMKFEMEKLRKKFNELEMDKNALNKKEERVKEVEARLHEQVKIVKEKIDGKRMSDIELAKYRKELEITKKENEVLKEKVNSMEDYQITKFENRALKNELQVLKESLDAKNQELERDRERWEREQRNADQKIMTLKRESRKAEQELILLKQRSQADSEEMASKYEAATGQVKRLQTFIKEHLAKLNSDYSATTQSLSHFRQSPSGITHHSRGHSLHHTPSHHHGKSYHQRSVSMDGFHRQASRTTARGCRLCSDDDDDTVAKIQNRANGLLTRALTFNDSILQLEEEEDRASTQGDDLEPSKPEPALQPVPAEPEMDSDEFVRKIVDKIYEKMASATPQKVPSEELVVSPSFEQQQTSKVSLKQTPSVHRTLYEELMMASELKPSSLEPMSKHNITPVKNQPPQLNGILNNDNDPNNNRIGSEDPKPQPKASEVIADTMAAPGGSAVAATAVDTPTSPSSKSESFEVDW